MAIAITKMQKCKRCGESKPLETAFSKAARCKTGYRKTCKQCMREGINRESASAASKLWRDHNRERANQYLREWRKRKAANGTGSER
ncbi:hypothetical protein LMG24235_01918 [Paraburkholderia sabiae]|nr:hypothetical protein LMG24235_01918 [Paraburkholderia sabiae]